MEAKKKEKEVEVGNSITYFNDVLSKDVIDKIRERTGVDDEQLARVRDYNNAVKVEFIKESGVRTAKFIKSLGSKEKGDIICKYIDGDIDLSLTIARDVPVVTRNGKSKVNKVYLVESRPANKDLNDALKAAKKLLNINSQKLLG